MIGRATLRTTLVLLILVAASTLGCMRNVELLGPTQFERGKETYIYFVEQEELRDSRLVKCDIALDNTTTCAVQYNLE